MATNSTKKTIDPNAIRVRDYVTMNELLRGKGGAHKCKKHYNRKSKDWKKET